jgi:hypothetical protein
VIVTRSPGGTGARARGVARSLAVALSLLGAVLAAPAASAAPAAPAGSGGPARSALSALSAGSGGSGGPAVGGTRRPVGRSAPAGRGERSDLAAPELARPAWAAAAAGAGPGSRPVAGAPAVLPGTPPVVAAAAGPGPPAGDVTTATCRTRPGAARAPPSAA